LILQVMLLKSLEWSIHTRQSPSGLGTLVHFFPNLDMLGTVTLLRYCLDDSVAGWGKYEARSTRTRIMLRVGSLLTSVDTLVKCIGTNYSSRISLHDMRIPIMFFSRLAMRSPAQYARRPNLLLLIFSQSRNHRSSSSSSQPQISTAY
jgi:hypothetical protein